AKLYRDPQSRPVRTARARGLTVASVAHEESPAVDPAAGGTPSEDFREQPVQPGLWDSVGLPYPGLRPFRPDETEIFFGREAALDAMAERLAQTRFLAVLGPSGCGKSSLVKTGLYSTLRLGLLPNAGGRWRIAELNPGRDPIGNLARALLRAR